jgi:hypothetical protein
MTESAGSRREVTRRKVQFDSFRSMFADIDRLHRDGYQRAGNWDLGTICCHLADAIERSMDGFLTRAPLLLRIVSPLILPMVLKLRRIPSGVNVAKFALPSGEQNATEQIARLRQVVARYVAFKEPLQPHPMFGRISRSQFDQVHLIHAAHHLSFLS